MRSVLKIETFYRVFRDISTAVHASTCVEEVLEMTVWKVAEVLNAKGAILRLMNLDTQQLELSAQYGLSEKYIAKGPVLRHKIITDLCRNNKVIVIKDICNDPRVQYPKEAMAEGIQMMLDLPLSIGDHIIGILRVFFSDQRVFSEEDLDFLVAIAQQCSCGIDKARIIEAQQSRYDQLALQTEKMSSLGRMAAGIAHEINNPLAGILLYSSNLIKKAPEKSPLKEGLDIIINETIRCRRIIQDLLEFSRERESRKVSANVNRIIQKALDILENEFRLSHINVLKSLRKTLPETLLDENQIEQVIVNILINAIEAIGTDGNITVESRLTKDKKWIEIDITDDGCGFASDRMDKIFEPFYSTKKKGTGLGLAVSYGIIRKHHGKIQAQGKTGEGARFTIKLPVAATSPPPDPAEL